MTLSMITTFFRNVATYVTYISDGVCLPGYVYVFLRKGGFAHIIYDFKTVQCTHIGLPVVRLVLNLLQTFICFIFKNNVNTTCQNGKVAY